jgi:hypothetical protein
MTKLIDLFFFLAVVGASCCVFVLSLVVENSYFRAPGCFCLLGWSVFAGKEQNNTPKLFVKGKEQYKNFRLFSPIFDVMFVFFPPDCPLFRQEKERKP